MKVFVCYTLLYPNFPKGWDHISLGAVEGVCLKRPADAIPVTDILSIYRSLSEKGSAFIALETEVKDEL